MQLKVGKIGVSIYDPSELDLLEKRNIFPEIVQSPYNIFDQKIHHSGWLQKLVDRGVEVHARSVFLQGLLLQDESCRDHYFSRWTEQFNQFKDFLEETGCTALEASLQVALANPLFTKIVVGVQSVKQLIDIVKISPLFKNEIKADHLACDDLDLIRPQNWQLENRN
jgi:aryl-alcohol dehydrogenase-like predicted oxidoreductase